MIVLGIILLVIGLLTKIAVLWTIGIIVSAPSGDGATVVRQVRCDILPLGTLGRASPCGVQPLERPGSALVVLSVVEQRVVTRSLRCWRMQRSPRLR